MKRSERIALEEKLNEVIETLIPSWQLNNINYQEELIDAGKLLEKYPEILNGCLIPENKRYSSLKYYFGASGDYLINNGMSVTTLDLPERPKYDILPNKVGQGYIQKKKKQSILEFIEAYE
jgi:hypothetical protein